MTKPGDLNLERVLTEALEDEYRARGKYRKIIDRFGPVPPFVKIVEAESRHISALLPLFRRYGITPPDEAADPAERVPDTLQDACAEGVKAEQENIALYDRLIAATPEPDVVRVLHNLQAASRDRHLPAFQRCLERSATEPAGQGGCSGDRKQVRRRGRAR